jgi:endonuclease G, mitochondrial
VDGDYANRAGYDVAFLPERRRAPLPTLAASLRRKAAVNRHRGRGPRHLLQYHHFSVLMNAERRVAFFTAVNIDGRLSLRPSRKKDRWFADPRIGADEQTDDALYRNNALDRGHLVRRLDPTWGRTPDIARSADLDTFHFTNSSPQHADFNRSKTLWAGLEDYVLTNADVRDLRVCVLTGPVFADNDPRFRGFKLPRSYWKIVAMVKADGRLSVVACLLSQARLLADLRDFAFAGYRTFQVPVSRVAQLTGLGFGNLPRFDPFTTRAVRAGGSGVLAARTGAIIRPIDDFREMII